MVKPNLPKIAQNNWIYFSSLLKKNKTSIGRFDHTNVIFVNVGIVHTNLKIIMCPTWDEYDINMCVVYGLTMVIALDKNLHLGLEGLKIAFLTWIAHSLHTFLFRKRNNTLICKSFEGVKLSNSRLRAHLCMILPFAHRKLYDMWNLCGH